MFSEAMKCIHKSANQNSATCLFLILEIKVSKG